MGICKYCGEKAGWFSDVHEACATSSQQGSAEIAATVGSTIKEKVSIPVGQDTDVLASQLWLQLEEKVHQIAAEHRTPAENVRQALFQGWSSGAGELAIVEPLSIQKFNVIVKLYKLMGFTEQDMRKSDGNVAALFSLLLWAVMVHGDPSELAPEHDHPFNLQPGEIPLMFFGSVVYSKETVSRSYQGGYGGMSVRLARGVYYHFGGFKGQRIDSSSLQEVDYGCLLLTTRNFSFGGEHTNFRIPFEHVLSFRAHTDGIGMFRDTANARAEVFSVLEANPNGGNPLPARPIFGWFLFNMAHFLAQPEARELYARANR